MVWFPHHEGMKASSDWLSPRGTRRGPSPWPVLRKDGGPLGCLRLKWSRPVGLSRPSAALRPALLSVNSAAIAATSARQQTVVFFHLAVIPTRKFTGLGGLALEALPTLTFDRRRQPYQSLVAQHPPQLLPAANGTLLGSPTGDGHWFIRPRGGIQAAPTLRSR